MTTKVQYVERILYIKLVPEGVGNLNIKRLDFSAYRND